MVRSPHTLASRSVSELQGRRSIRLGAVAVGLACCAAALGLPTAAFAVDQNAPDRLIDQPLLPGTGSNTPAPPLAAAAVTAEVSQWLTGLQATFGDDEAWASATISRDRSSVDVAWFGQPSTALLDEIANAPAGLAVTLTSAPYLPGELRDRVDELVGTELSPGVEVSYAMMNADASGITVGVDGAGRQLMGAASAAPEVDGIPITVRGAGEILPASRSDEAYLIGGATLQNPVSGVACSSGFSVTNAESGRSGMLTAGHCGVVGDVFSLWTTAADYYFGEIDAKNAQLDAAVIVDSEDLYLYEGYVWNGPIDGGSPVAITGTADPVIGTELCFSGSYSGLTCGSFVTGEASYLDPEGNLVTGVLTESIDGSPAFGNGDSGGPGVVPVFSDTGYTFHAATIISAIANAQASSNCQGVPGAEGGRQCSPVGLSTKAVDAAASLGLLITTVE